ncbi:MAG: hypothetical protein ACOVN3_07420 [Limnohabitans sp.]
MSPSAYTQRTHMRLASVPAPLSSLAMVLIVPQPVNIIVAVSAAAKVAVFNPNRMRVLLIDLIELSRFALIRKSPVMP